MFLFNTHLYLLIRDHVSVQSLSAWYLLCMYFTCLIPVVLHRPQSGPGSEEPDCSLCGHATGESRPCSSASFNLRGVSVLSAEPLSLTFSPGLWVPSESAL